MLTDDVLHENPNIRGAYENQGEVEAVRNATPSKEGPNDGRRQLNQEPPDHHPQVWRLLEVPVELLDEPRPTLAPRRDGGGEGGRSGSSGGKLSQISTRDRFCPIDDNLGNLQCVCRYVVGVVSVCECV